MSSLRSEEGETLVEMIIAIAILGTAVVAILAAILTGITLSLDHRVQTDGNALVLRAAEVLKDQTSNPYASCGQASDYNPTSGLTVPSAWTVTITGVQYWNGSTWQPRSGGATPDDTCLGPDQVAGTTDDEWKGSEHLQKLTVSAAGPRSTTRALDVVKGNS